MKSIFNKYQTMAYNTLTSRDNCKSIIKCMVHDRHNNHGLIVFDDIYKSIDNGLTFLQLKKFIEREAKSARKYALTSASHLASIPPVVLSRMVIELVRDMQSEMIKLALIDNVDLVKINNEYKASQTS